MIFAQRRNISPDFRIYGFLGFSKVHLEYILLRETTLYSRTMRAQMSTEYKKITAVEKQLFD